MLFMNLLLTIIWSFSSVSWCTNAHELGDIEYVSGFENGEHFSINVPENGHKYAYQHISNEGDHSHGRGESGARTHSCIHDYIKVDKHKSPQNYRSHPNEIKKKLNELKNDENVDEDEIEFNRRRLAISEEDYDYIRITPYWDELEDNVDDDDLLAYIKLLVSSAIEFFETTLKVYPVQDVLYIHPAYSQYYISSPEGFVNYYSPSYYQRQCIHVTIPDEHIGTGFAFSSYRGSGTTTTISSGGGGTGVADSDLVIYVSANDTFCGSSTLAFATSCDQDQYGRPVAGTINFCTGALENQYFKEDIDITVHELLHVLGMSSGLYPEFIDPDTGKKYDSDEVYTTRNNFTYIITDRVKTISQEHYGCDDAIGQPLEDDGSSGTAGSHWEYLHTAYEIMIGFIAASDMKVSYFTMGLLEDSGWYIVDYDYLEPYWWGYNTSCKFYNGTCIENNVATFDQYFCDEEAYGCIHNYEQTGKCIIGDYYTIDFQWFTDDSSLGGSPLAENCPLWYATDDDDTFTGYCWDERGNNQSYYYASQLSNYPIVYGAGSRCVNVDTSEVTDDDSYADTSTTLGLCLQHSCTGYDSSYDFSIGDIFSKNTGRYSGVSITIGSETVNCTRYDGYNKTKKYVATYDVTIECPLVDYVCYGELPFECEYGYYNNDLNKCVCSPGYDGDTCSNKMNNTRSGVTLYTGTTPAPTTEVACVSDSDYSNGILDGTWEQDGIYGVYMSYKYTVSSTTYYLWFDAWYHNWVISTTRGVSSTTGNYTNAYLVCSLGRYYVPDVQDCNGGDWVQWSNGGATDSINIEVGCNSTVTNSGDDDDDDDSSAIDLKSLYSFIIGFVAIGFACFIH